MNQQPTSDERLLAGYPGRMLVTASLARVALQTGRFFLSPLLPTIIEEFQITEATTGTVLASFQSVYAITQYPGDEYPDWWTRATFIVPGLNILVLGFLMSGLAGDLAGFVVAAVITGLGKRLSATPSRTFLFDLFVERRGWALGLYAADTDLGGPVPSGFAILALTYTTWWTSFLPAVVVLAELTVLYALWSRDGYAMGSPELHVSGTLRRLFASAEQRRMLLASGLSYFMVGGLINFFPTYLIEAKGFDQQLVSATFAIVFAIGITIKPVAGGLSDRFRRESIAVVGMLVTAGALAILSAVEARPFIYVSVVALAAGYRMEFPLADAIVMDNASDADRGVDLGAVRALSLGVNALGSTYVGIVVTYASYVAAFAGLAVCLVVFAGLLYWDVRKR